MRLPGFTAEDSLYGRRGRGYRAAGRPARGTAGGVVPQDCYSDCSTAFARCSGGCSGAGGPREWRACRSGCSREYRECNSACYLDISDPGWLRGWTTIEL